MTTQACVSISAEKYPYWVEIHVMYYASFNKDSRTMRENRKLCFQQQEQAQECYASCNRFVPLPATKSKRVMTMLDLPSDPSGVVSSPCGMMLSHDASQR